MNNDNNLCCFNFPRFFRDDPESWFLHLETHFSHSNIVSDMQKYLITMSHLSNEVLSSINLNLNPNDNRYETFKAAILIKFKPI